MTDENNKINNPESMKSTQSTGSRSKKPGRIKDSLSAKSLPANYFLDLSLCKLSEMIRKDALSSTHLVESYLERIRKFDGPSGINAYITVAAEEAIEQAEELDRLAKQNHFKGPLHGLPIAIKDNLDTKNIRTTGGSKILESWKPQIDANVVQKLKKAGAVILGKTNMHEFAYGITTNNPHYGPTRNPYDLTRIPGGSSGGSAAATAADLCAGAIGTDTGGSVRIPAALCGLVGLKPTLGRVGRGGMIYLSHTRDVIGPITKTVADSAIILEAIAGIDYRDPISSSNSVPPYFSNLKKALKGKTFGVPKKTFFEEMHPDTEKVIQDVIKEITSLGGNIKEVEVNHLDKATETGFCIVMSECIYLMENYLKDFDPHASVEKYFGQFGPDVREILRSQKGTSNSKPIPAYVYVESLLEDRNKMIAGFQEAMINVEALLLPTTPLPASKIGEDDEIELLGKKVNTFLTFIKNCDPISVVGYPAITVPAGYSTTGLPIGLQIVARPWEEENLLCIAYAFEQATRIRKPPKL